MRLTQFTDYGLRVLMYLATRDQAHVTTEQIAEGFGISRDHPAQGR
ncbi:MAG: Rrf2 family transcriptional regulator [Deltaproteobacteria bacterium]|nr:Rrf2 family transcriptional regulator [Deltaproteobacteria bacterium]